MKINQFIFCILFEIFTLKFLEKKIAMFQLDATKFVSLVSFKIKNGNIYFIYTGDPKETHENSTLLEIDSEKDEVIKKSVVPGKVQISAQLTNDINVFIISRNCILFQIDGIFSEVKAVLSYQFFLFTDMSFNADSLLLRFRQYFSVGEKIDQRPIFVLSKYPYTSNYIIKRVDCNPNYDSFKIAPLKECFVLCFSYKKDNTLSFQILDSDLNIIKIKNITSPVLNNSNSKFYLSKLSEKEYFNEFIICFVYSKFQGWNEYVVTTCNIIKYENSELKIGKEFEIFSMGGFDFLMDFYICLYEQNNKNNILFVISCNSDKRIQLTKAIYSNGVIQFDEAIHQYELEPNLIKNAFYNPIVTINQKGISIFYLSANYPNYSVNKFYLNSVCDSKRIYLFANILETFPIEEIVFKGIDELKFSFVNIDTNLKIFKKNRLIKENEFFTDLNNFTYIFNIENPEDKFNDIYYLYIKMKSGYICMIEIQIKTSIIEFGSKEFKCYIESNGRINDVYYNNLDTELSIGNNQHALEIYFKYQYYLPKGNELKIYYENILIDCSPNINNQYNVTCKIPLIYVEFSKKKYIF